MEATKIQVSILKDEEMVCLNAADAQINLPEIVRQVAADDQTVILTLEGKEMAMIISMEAFEFLERMIDKIEDEIDLEALRQARKESEGKKNITLEELKQELGFEGNLSGLPD